MEMETSNIGINNSSKEILIDHRPSPFLPIGSTWEMVGDLLTNLTTVSEKELKLNTSNPNINTNENTKSLNKNVDDHVDVDEDNKSNNNNSSSSGFPSLNENFMDIFGILPSEDPLVLVICTKCSKPIKQSRFTTHYEHCKSIPSNHLNESNKHNGNSNGNGSHEKKKSSTNGLVPLSRGRPKKKIDPPQPFDNVTIAVDQQPKKISQSLSSRKRSFDTMRKNTNNSVNIDKNEIVNSANIDVYSGTEDEDDKVNNMANQNSNCNDNQQVPSTSFVESVENLDYWSIPISIVPLATKKSLFKTNRLKRIIISLESNNTTQYITISNEEKDLRSLSDEEYTNSNKNNTIEPVEITNYLTKDFLNEHLHKAHTRIQNFQNYQREFQQQQLQQQQQQLQTQQQQQLQQQLQQSQQSYPQTQANAGTNTINSQPQTKAEVISPPITPAINPANTSNSNPSTSSSKKKSSKDKKSRREEKNTEESPISPQSTEKIKKKKSKKERDHVEKVKKPTKKALKEQAAAAAAIQQVAQPIQTNTTVTPVAQATTNALPLQSNNPAQVPMTIPQQILQQNPLATTTSNIPQTTTQNMIPVQPGQLTAQSYPIQYNMPMNGQINMQQTLPIFPPNQQMNTSTFPVYNPQMQTIPIQPQMPYAKPMNVGTSGYVSPQQNPMNFTGTIGAPNPQQSYQMYKQPAQMMPQTPNSQPLSSSQMLQIQQQIQFQNQQNRVYQPGQVMANPATTMVQSSPPPNIRSSTSIPSPQGGVVPMMVNQWQPQNQPR